MSNQISIILEELRNLVAKNNDEKDNVIVDLFDSLKEALDLLVEQNTLLKGKIEDKPTKIIGCAFGVGLSWGTVAFETEHLLISELVEV